MARLIPPLPFENMPWRLLPRPIAGNLPCCGCGFKRLNTTGYSNCDALVLGFFICGKNSPGDVSDLLTWHQSFNVIIPTSVSFRMDSHCRVLFTCVYTHANFTRVNKIEARYRVLSLNMKWSEIQFLRLRATFHALPLLYLEIHP